MHYLRPTRTKLLVVVPTLLVVAVAFGTAFAALAVAKAKPAKTKPSKTIGTVVAYGLVKPLCGTCDRPRGFTPLVGNESEGVSLTSQPTTYEKGTWCFKLTSAGAARKQVVIVSLESGEPGAPLAPPGEVSVASAQWVAAAPDCKPKEIEIKTLRYSADANGYPSVPPNAGLTAIPTGEVPFSFVVIR